MEKIYEEQIGGGKKPRGQINFSIVLSFAVAAFAIVSLIAVGFNQISFAAPTSINDSNLTFYLPQQGDRTLSVAARTDGGDYFIVPFYQANVDEMSIDAAYPLFCLEHHVGINASDGGQAYERAEAIEDTGLVYILNLSSTMNVSGNGIVPRIGYTDEEYKFVERYATQIAIWVYLHETKYIDGGDGRYSLANETADASEYGANLQIIENATYIVRNDILDNSEIALVGANGASFYDSYILPVVNVAKGHPVLKTLTINGDSTISKVGDDNYYQTEALSVSCDPNDMTQFQVSVSGIEGAFVVDGDYNTVEDGIFTNPSSTFHVRIPVQSVSETARTIRIDVSAIALNYPLLAKYVATTGDYQAVVVIVGDGVDLYASKEIPVVGSPDTGMNKAQTIYFIGLIVLLCGVGIIYANAKPVETE